MGKKEYCQTNEYLGEIPFGMCSGIFVHGIEYGIDDYVYFSAIFGGKTTYHKSKIRYTEKGSYFVYNGKRLYFSDIMWDIFQGVRI